MVTTGLSRAEQSEKTRRALLDAARALFTERGYTNTSTEEVVRRSQVTRGALHYHFRDKVTLFEAVYNEVRMEYLTMLQTDIEAMGGDAWQMLMMGVEQFLRRLIDPSVRRILYIDGPAVLDCASEERRELSCAMLRGLFGPLMEAGSMKRLPLDTLVRQLWTLFFQAAVDIAVAEDRDLARRNHQAVLQHILNGLRQTDESRESMLDQVGKSSR